MHPTKSSTPERLAIPPWPGVMPEVEESVLRALRDGSWGRYDGPYGVALAQALAERFTQPLVTLCASGTIAVELALRGLGVEPGQEVILGGYDFPGNFRAIEAIGAIPVLVDMAAEAFIVDIDQVSGAVSEKTAAVIVSHLHGALAPMRRWAEFCKERGIALLEDACQAPGATFDDGAPAGAMGDAAVLSFGGSKLLSAGRGGAVLTRSSRVHQRMKVFHDRGNLAFPLSELQAAALLPQLELLGAFHQRRLDAAQWLRERLAKMSPSRDLLAFQGAAEQGMEGASRAYYKFPIALPPQARDAVCHAAEVVGIPLFPGFRGFAARSSRRCRIASPLTQAQKMAAETALLHHSALLLDRPAIERVAELLVMLLPKSECTS